MTGPERDKLIEDNLQLVWYVMARYYPSTINSPEREDFFQIGCIGLIFAANNYEPGSVKFSTFAARNIQCRLRNELQSRYCQCRTGETCSLDSPIPELADGSLDILGTISDERWNPDHQVYDLEKFESTLTKAQLSIFKLMLEGFNPSQIAEKLGCSRQNVAQKIDRIQCEFAEFYNSPEWYTGKLKTKHERKA